MRAAPNPTGYGRYSRDEWLQLLQAGVDRRRAERIEVYRELRADGVDHKTIAARLGIKFESLIRSLARADVYLPEPHEVPSCLRLDELIASGREFTVRDLPEAVAPVNASALHRAVGSKRIVVRGVKPVQQCGRNRLVRVYQAAQEDSQCLRTA